MALATVTGVLVLAQAPPGLRIVVIEGENAVNIIQQKTAVRALVEVRDRNNLPVAGATVTFAVSGQGGATVAGSAPSLTVTTNAAGQAALAGGTPLTSGSLQISVNATFNGLTATASMSQTVLTTTAAAAAGTAGAAGAAGTAAGATGGAAGAAGAAGAGAAGAAGGGLSLASIAGIVGGAAAVGGGIAAAGSGDDSGGSGKADPTGGSGPGPTGLLPSCEFAVTPQDILVGNEGATVALAIVMKNVDPCYDSSWSVNLGTAANWVSVSPLSGSRNGSAVLTIAPYAPTPAAPNRVATIIVAYERVLISQPFRSPAAAVRARVSLRSAPQPGAGLAVRDDR
jgi:hypothetical protein